MHARPHHPPHTKTRAPIQRCLAPTLTRRQYEPTKSYKKVTSSSSSSIHHHQLHDRDGRWGHTRDLLSHRLSSLLFWSCHVSSAGGRKQTDVSSCIGEKGVAVAEWVRALATGRSRQVMISLNRQRPLRSSKHPRFSFCRRGFSTAAFPAAVRSQQG